MKCRFPIADTIVFGQHDPATLGDFCKPDFVECAGLKMLRVDFYGSASIFQGVGDYVPPEPLIEKENWVVRRLVGGVRT